MNINLMWSSKKKKPTQKQADRAAPSQEPRDAFVVPNYDVGGPYVSSIPDYADNPHNGGSTRDISTHGYQTVSEQFNQFRKYNGTYPDPAEPPQEWEGYETESYQRSERQEHLINGAEGFPNPQKFLQWALNPYWYRNVVNRPQRTPHEYSFLRRYDKDTLGKRNLTGEHDSQATTGMSSAPLKGMTSTPRKRSTYRIDPIQYSVGTVDDNVEAPPFSTTFTSPDPGFAPRSYRLG